MDTSTIAASGADVRSLVKVVDVAASPAEVWAAWTSNEGIAAWWAPPKTNIELRIGGRFELHFSLDLPMCRGSHFRSRGMPLRICRCVR